MAPNSQDNATRAAAAWEAERAFTGDASPRVDQRLELMRRYLAAVTHSSEDLRAPETTTAAPRPACPTSKPDANPTGNDTRATDAT
jgi:hypothetical protein